MSRTMTVLALARSTGGYYHGELLSGLIREVTAAGGQVVVANTVDPGTQNVDTFGASQFSLPVAWDEVDGVVAVALATTGPYLDRLRALGKPVVLASHHVDGFDAPVAMPDNHGGVRAGVEHLIAHGHTRIGFVGTMSQYDYRERYAAYREVMADHGLSAGEDLFFPATNYAESGGADAGRAVVAATERPTALMVASDQNALGVIQELTAAGLSVPNDIAVMGFDNVEQGISTTPTLSSVCQRFDEVGALAGRLVMACIRGDEVRPGKYTAEAVVVFPRGSCGCRNDPFGDPGKPSERSTGIAVAPEELGRMLHTLFDGRDSGALDADAVGVITSEVERLLLEPEEVTPDRLRCLVRTLQQMTSREETLQGLATALTEYVQRLVCTGSVSGAPTAIRLAAMLWQMQTSRAVQQSHRLESSVLEQSDVAAALLRADASAARGLLWMADTHVRAGMLALWEGPPSEGRLRIAGVYDSTGLLDCTLGEEADIRHFPPRDMLGLARTSEGEVCLVLPVRTGERDWGVLAMLGVINTTSTREVYHNWTSLLCAAFEGEELEEAVRASEERLAYAARASNDGQWELDLSTRTLYLSARCSDLLNLPPDAEPDVETWIAAVHPEDVEAVRATMEEAAARCDVPVQVEYRVLTADGSFRWVLSRSLGVGTADGSVVRLIGSLSDIHPRKELEEQLRQAALYDTVTGLPNRRLFLDRLTWAVEQSQRGSGARFAVVFLDLDSFKLINDSLGHLMGDELLRTVGARLRSDLRSVDTAARFGGDEFAVLLFDLKHEAVLSIVERIQERVAAPVVLAGHEVSVTASVGIATSETGYTEAEDVLRDADIAMYQAKDAERGTASVFDPAMHIRATGRLQAQSELRTALIEEQFVVHYQPVVSLDGSALAQFEALVRWEHPERGILLPGDFLPVMAETGTIVTLGQWIIDSVCAQVAAWRTDYDGPVAVSVNLSHREFWSEQLLLTVTQSLSRHHVPSRCLILEITESVIMADPEAARQVMADLYASGVRLYINDFGTGQSSLHALRAFPVDALKIDQSFVQELDVDVQTTELVRIIVTMGRILGIDVVAEGVETAAQADQLRTMGCGAAQGWLYAKAMPGTEAGAMLGERLAERIEAPTREV